jgi:hypothetical protein
MNEESVLVYGERSLNEPKIEPGFDSFNRRGDVVRRWKG